MIIFLQLNKLAKLGKLSKLFSMHIALLTGGISAERPISLRSSE